MRIVRQAVGICRESSRPLVVLNIVYFGLFLLGFAFASCFPQARELMVQEVKQALSEGALSPVHKAYARGNAPKAILLTFTVNLVLGAFVFITLPSLILPFSGILTGSLRAFAWGFIVPLTILSGGVSAIFFFVLLLVLLEGEGYVVAMLASFVQGRALLFPASVGVRKRLQGYTAGLRATATLYLVVATVLAVAALYEVVLVFALRVLRGTK